MLEETRLSELVDALPSYPVRRSSFSFDPSLRREMGERIEREMRGVECDRLLTLDGFRAESQDGWFLVRLSGTEPKIRITSEARDAGTLERMATLANDIVRRCLA
jgi:phosphoglucosamine mutase